MAVLQIENKSALSLPNFPRKLEDLLNRLKQTLEAYPGDFSEELFCQQARELMFVIHSSPVLSKAFISCFGKKTCIVNNQLDLDKTLAYLTKCAKNRSLKPEHLEALKSRLYAPALLQQEGDFLGRQVIVKVNTRGATTTALTLAQRCYSPHLAQVEPESLRGLFSKSYKKTRAMIVITEQLGAVRNLCQSAAQKHTLLELQIQLKAWTTHYLMRVAKIPVLDTQQRPFHPLPFIDFISNNESTYYRGDGGTILNLYLDQLNHTYPYLFENTIVGVIKNNHFKIAAKATCVCEYIQSGFCAGKPYLYVKIDDIEDLENEDTLAAEECSFLDISALFRDSSDDIQEMMNQVKTRLGSLPPQTVVGGVLRIGSPGQDVFIFFPKTTSDSSTEDFVGQLKNFQGTQGIYPDIFFIREQLIQLGFDLHDLIKKYPFRDQEFDLDIVPYSPITLEEISLEQVQEARQQLQKTTQEATSTAPLNTFMTSHYLSVIHHVISCLAGYELKTTSFPFVLDLVLQSVQRIERRILRIQQTSLTGNRALSFQENLITFHLIIEDITYLLIFLRNPSVPSPEDELIHTLNALSPPQRELQELGIDKTSFLFTSGMSAFSHLTDALRALYPQEDGTKSQALFLEGSYYEMTETTGLIDYMSRHYNGRRASLEEVERDLEGISEYDVLFMDLYPNHVTLPSVRKTPIKTLIGSILARRQKEIPLTVVLDTSTNLFFDPEVTELITETLNQPIQEGRLHLVIANSLTKFCSCGFDKYTGGVIQTYGRQESLEPLIRKLKSRSLKDNLSAQSAQFFHFFLSKPDLVLQHLYQIRQNNDSVYRQLLPLSKLDAPLHMGEREPGIPMMGLHFSEILKALYPSSSPSDLDSHKVILTVLMQFYLYGKIVKESLPMTMRGSFAFPHSTLMECGTALRLTIGLEDPEILTYYAKIILAINIEIGSFLSDQTNTDSKEVLREMLEEEQEAMTERMTNHKPQLIQFAKREAFDSFVHRVRAALPSRSL